MNKQTVEQFFSEIDQKTVINYTKYWESIKPITRDEVFKRYLFAFTSVHSTWQSNLRGYNAIKDLGWVESKAELLQRLDESRCGIHNQRTEFIWDFKSKFYANPDYYCESNKDWQGYRNSLVAITKGLGLAKISFALEMCFPIEAQVTCLDTHIIQFYNIPIKSFSVKSKKSLDLYQDAENHWVDCSKEINASPTITRAIYWDRKQKKEDSRYWTYALEA